MLFTPVVLLAAWRADTLFGRGTHIAYVGAPSWQSTAGGPPEYGRFDLEVKIDGETASVEAATLLRNPANVAWSGTISLPTTSISSDTLPWPTEKHGIALVVTLDGEKLRADAVAGAISIRQAEGQDLSGAPVEILVPFHINLPAKSEETLVVRYSSPLGRLETLPGERLFAFDFAPLLDKPVKPHIYLRISKATSLGLRTMIPTARATKSPNGRLVDIDKLDLHQSTIMMLRLDTL